MNIYNNLLILFGLDCRIQVLGLEGGRETSTRFFLDMSILEWEKRENILKLIEEIINNFKPFYWV